MLLLAQHGAAQPVQDPRSVARAIASAGDVQTRLPDRNASPKLTVTPPILKDLAGALPIIFGLWVILALIALGFGIAFVVSSTAGVRVKAADSHQKLDANQQSDAPERMLTGSDILSRADELANMGRCSEAVHQMLAETLLMLRRRVSQNPSDSLTSRELLCVLSLEDVERRALLEMIPRVERTWFGVRAASLDDYRAVRASFETLVSA